MMTGRAFRCVAGMLLLAGCSKPSDKTDAAASAAAPQPAANGKESGGPSAADARFSKDLENKTCELLTPAMVSQVSGVAVSDLKVTTPSRWCRYQGGGVTATLMFIRVGKDARSVAFRFSNAYRNRTGAQVAKQMEKVKAAVDHQKTGGQTDEATAKHAKAVANAVTAGPLASGFRYEAIAGPWDKAMLDTSERDVKLPGRVIKNFGNQIHVRVANMVFTIEYQTQEPALHKDEVVALAKLVTQGLPK